MLNSCSEIADQTQVIRCWRSAISEREEEEVEERVKHFTDLHVWRMSHQLFLNALRDVTLFPKGAKGRILADQLIRCVGAIGANVAEGFNSRTTKKYVNYLDIARNSNSETENWYYKDAEWFDAAVANQRIRTSIDISEILQSMISKLTQSTVEKH